MLRNSGPQPATGGQKSLAFTSVAPRVFCAVSFPPLVGATRDLGPPLRLMRTPPLPPPVCHGGRGRSIGPHGAGKQRNDKQTAEGPTHHFQERWQVYDF